MADLLGALPPAVVLALAWTFCGGAVALAVWAERALTRQEEEDGRWR